MKKDVSVTAEPTVDWLEQAKQRWPDAVWIVGNGPFALLAHCRDLSVSLWESRQDAEKSKLQIDQTGCGGRCQKDHEIKDLGKLRPVKTLVKKVVRRRRRSFDPDWD